MKDFKDINAWEFLENFIPKGAEKSITTEWERLGFFPLPLHYLDKLIEVREKAYQWELLKDKEKVDGVQDETEYRHGWLVDEIDRFRRLEGNRFKSYMKIIGEYIQYCTNEKKKLTRQAKPERTFHDLFGKPSWADYIEEYFNENGFVVNGKWIGRSKKPSELAKAYYALRDLGKIKVKNKTADLIFFYDHYYLKVGKYISKRNLTNEITNQDDYNFFLKALSNRKELN